MESSKDNFKEIIDKVPRVPRRWGPFLARISLGVVLLVLVLLAVDVSSVLDNFRAVRPLPIALMCVFALFDRWLMAYKWNLLLRIQQIHIPHWQATRLVFIGYLLGTFTPGAIGADAYRVTALSLFQRTPAIVSTVILERLIGLMVIATFAVIGLPFSASYLGVESSPLIWTVVLGTAMIAFVVWLSFRSCLVEGIAQRIPFLSGTRIGIKLGEFYRAYIDHSRSPSTLIYFTLLTALEVIVLVTMTYFVVRAFGIGVSFGYLLCIIPLVHIIIRLPISFQGIGIFEGLLAYFLLAAGFAAADGVAIALMFRVTELAIIILPATIMLWAAPARIQP